MKMTRTPITTNHFSLVFLLLLHARSIRFIPFCSKGWTRKFAGPLYYYITTFAQRAFPHLSCPCSCYWPTTKNNNNKNNNNNENEWTWNNNGSWMNNGEILLLTSKVSEPSRCFVCSFPHFLILLFVSYLAISFILYIRKCRLISVRMEIRVYIQEEQSSRAIWMSPS